MIEFTILVLVDWSNVSKRAISDIIGSVLSSIEPIGDCIKGRCEVRLYGGWDEEGGRSQDAQKVVEEIANWDLEQMNINCHQNTLMKLVPVIILKPELAETLLSDNTYRFQRTYRKKRPAAGNIRIAKPGDIGCSNPGQDCFLIRVERFLDKQKDCPGCSQRTAFTHQEPLCYRNEQKMVDTMLSCDLAFAVRVYDCVVLVSADDDFIPVLRQVSSQDNSSRLVRATPKRINNNQRSLLQWRNLEEIEV